MSKRSVFDALADPVRRSLLETLATDSPKTATQLATAYPISRQAILKHLNILEDAALVTVHQHGREKRYVLTPAPLAELHSWLDMLGQRWDERLLRLKTLLEEGNAL